MSISAVLRCSCSMCRVLLLFSFVAMSMLHINNTRHITYFVCSVDCNPFLIIYIYILAINTNCIISPLLALSASAWVRLVYMIWPSEAELYRSPPGYNLLNKPAKSSPVFFLHPANNWSWHWRTRKLQANVLESDSNQLADGYGSTGAVYGIKVILVEKHRGQPCS